NANLTGDVTSVGNDATVVKINGTSLSGLATGLLKNTTSTGVPSIAINSDLPAMSATVGGAVPTPPNNTTTYLRGDGTFATPAGTGVTTVTVTATNGVSGTVANPTTTPTITVVLGSPVKIGSYSVTTTGTSTITGNNTGDGTVTAGTGISIAGTAPTFTITNSSPSLGGTVTSVTSATGDATVATTTTTPVITIVSAPKLTTGRTIALTGDVTYTSPSFDGSGNVTAAGTVVKVGTTSVTTNASFYPLFVASTSGSQVVDLGTGLTFNPSTNNLTTTTFTGALTGNVTGNATTAATLLTARNIWGQSFNGSANVT